MNDTDMKRIGIFYDGNYFSHVSNYYNYSHERNSRISIPGLHNFIEDHCAELIRVDPLFCKVSDAHYFRGKFSPNEARDKNKLFPDRVFEEVLMRNNINTHHSTITGKGEKGIDVLFAVEALDKVSRGMYDIVVLIAGDGDYIPLIRKIHSHNVMTMVLGWNFDYQDERGNNKATITSTSLLEECNFPVLMEEVINQGDGEIVDQLFLDQ